MPIINVFIVDDHPLVIEGIRALLANEPDMVVTGAAGSGAAALEALRTTPAEVVLLDINLPDISGIELCAMIKSQFPPANILALSTFKERSYITRMMENGASGYALKGVSKEELAEAIRQVRAGRLYFSMDVAEVITRQAQSRTLPLLTQREKEVLACIAEGLVNKEIAEKLFISTLTVDTHRKNLLAKFGVKNTAALIRIAVQEGLLE